MARVALVTGGVAGIGAATCRALQKAGYQVAATFVSDVAAARKLREEYEIRTFQWNVADFAACHTGVDEVVRTLGPIDVLVNNAGVNVGKERGPTHEFLDVDWHRIIRVDLDGVFYCSRAVSAGMVKRRKGVIINISSVFGLFPARLQCAYTAAKAAVANFTRAHAVEVGPYGVRVNGVAPGSTLTEGTRTMFYNPEAKKMADSLLSHVPLGRPGEGEDVAAAVLYLVSDDAQYVTGHILVVDGGWTAGFSLDA